MKTLSYLFCIVIATFFVCPDTSAQELSESRKEKIAAEIYTLFKKSVEASESVDIKKLNSTVDDTLKAGFIDNGHFFRTFDEVLEITKKNATGVSSQKINISTLKITVLAENAALLTTSGNYSLLIDDGRTFTGRFGWTFVYSKIDDNWKIIHTHMSNPQQ